MHSPRLLLAILSFLYWAFRRLLELLVLCGRSERSKEVEILVLRHELYVLRRGQCYVVSQYVTRHAIASITVCTTASRWSVGDNRLFWTRVSVTAPAARQRCDQVA